MISSCSSSSSSYTNVIPNNVDAVVSINVGDIIEKTGFYSDKEIQTLLLDAIKTDASRSLYSLTENIVSDINKSGIDFKSPIYAAINSIDNEEVMFVAKLGNVKDFEGMIDVLISENLCGNICRDYDTFSHVFLGNGDAILAYNDESIIAVQIPRGLNTETFLKSVINTLMTQTSDKSLASNKGFSKMLSQSSDVGFFVNYENLMGAQRANVSQLGFDANLLKDSYLFGGLGFNKGTIVLCSEYYTENNSMKEQLSVFQDIMPTLDGAYLPYISESASAMVAMGLNGGVLLDFVNSANSGISSAAKNGFNQMSDILSSFDGDVTISMEGDSDYTGFISAASGDKASKLIPLIESTIGMRFKKSGDDSYNLNLGRGMNFNLGVSGSNVYVSNDTSKGTDIYKKVKNSITDIDLVTKVSDKSLFFYGDVNSDFVKSAFRSELRRNPEIAYLMDEVKHVEFSLDKNFKVEAVLVLKNNKENALKVFTDAISKLARSFR
ncbi:MAG: DUF4836 family protein [Rikenellaceae bacterium]